MGKIGMSMITNLQDEFGESDNISRVFRVFREITGLPKVIAFLAAILVNGVSLAQAPSDPAVVMSYDLDIDSDNNNGTLDPDRSSWEEQIENDPYSIGKLVIVGSERLTPVVFQQLSIASDIVEKGSSVEHSVTFDCGQANPNFKLWRDEQKSKLIEFGKAHNLEELLQEGGTVSFYFEAVESAKNTGTKVDIEKFGRPDLFLSATVTSREGAVACVCNVRVLPVQPGSFWPHLLATENRHYRSYTPALLVNGGQVSRTSTDAKKPIDSKLYGFRKVTELEAKTLLDASSLSEAAKRFCLDNLFYNTRTSANPAAGGTTGMQIALYRDYNSGNYVLAFPNNSDDQSLEIFKQYKSRDTIKLPFANHKRSSQLLADCLRKVKWFDYDELVFVGVDHGGVLATIGSLASGFDAIVYDMPQIPRGYFVRYLMPFNGTIREAVVDGSMERLAKAKEYISWCRINERDGVVTVIVDSFISTD